MTSSVKFIDEFIDELITQFSQRTDPLLPGSYTIRLDDFDLAGDPPLIPVFLSNFPFPYKIPICFFYNLSPPLQQPS